jgi:hypothetical protein
MGGVPRVVLDLLRNLSKEKFDLTLMLNLYKGKLMRGSQMFFIMS